MAGDPFSQLAITHEGSRSQSLHSHRLSNLMSLIIFYLLVFPVACANGYEPTALYQYLEILSEESSYRAVLAYVGALPLSEKEDPAFYEFLSVSMSNGSGFNLRPPQITHDSFLGTRLTWIKFGNSLVIRLHPQDLSLFLGPYLKQVISVGNEIKPAYVPKPGGWSRGFLFNQTKKVEATLAIVAVIVGLFSVNWKTRITTLKALYSSLMAWCN